VDQVVDWTAIQGALAAPFEPAEVEWRAATGKGGANKHVQLVAYISAAAVMDRLDQAVGAGNWSFDWQPLVVDTEVRVAKGTLTIFHVSKSDIGTASNWEPSKGCVSDTLKRCAVLWGVGRYLRDLPQVGCTLDANGNIPEEMLAKLREALRRRQTARSA